MVEIANIVSELTSIFQHTSSCPLFDSVPAALYWKDYNGIYLGQNCTAASMLKNAGFEKYSKHNSVIGKNDQDIFGTETANTFLQHDQELFENPPNCRKTFIEKVSLQNSGAQLVLSQKQLLLSNSGQIAGIMGCTISLDGPILKFLTRKLITIRQQPNLIIKKLKACLNPVDVKTLQSNCTQLTYLCTCHQVIPELKLLLQLTHRELISLCLLSKGYSHKQIANYLFLSPRTIEQHIASCKLKLNCPSRNQLTIWLWELLTSLLLTTQN